MIMLDYFISLFGVYEPIQSLVSGSELDGTAVYSYSCNWAYIFNCVFVAIVLWSIMRLIGLLLGGSRR